MTLRNTTPAILKGAFVRLCRLALSVIVTLPYGVPTIGVACQMRPQKLAAAEMVPLSQDKTYQQALDVLNWYDAQAHTS